jgi:uncharacterized membrane protein YkoI
MKEDGRMLSIILRKKRRVVAAVAAAVVAFAGFAFIEAEPAEAASKFIGKSKALKVALKHAGLKKSQVRDIDVERDYEHGRWIYEVDFEKGKKEYNYDIHAKTGKVLYEEIEYDD